MNRVIIGLVGEQCAGKEKFWELLCGVTAEYLKDNFVFTINRFSTSVMLAEILDRCGAPTSRQNKIALVKELEEKFGEGTVVAGLYRRLETDKTTIKVIDSIRLHADEEALRRKTWNILLYITAEKEVRYRRSKERARDPQDQKMTIEEFEAIENTPTEINVPYIGARADWKIENNESDEVALKNKVREFFTNQVAPLLTKEG
ncbi:MAG: hypothetical protein Q7S83_03805 [bacterium]|nr:hypothetical protein [bacterium]